jgi:DNA-binding IclR family transcriptional regulator
MTAPDNTHPARKNGSPPRSAEPSSGGLVRDLELLHALAGDEARQRGGIGVVRLAQIVQRDKSQVSRALRALEAAQLVERDPDSREYRLGWVVFALAARMIEPRLMQTAPRMMRLLVDELGESVHLCVLQNDQVLTVHTEAPRHHIRATGWVGRAIPCYCSSAGRVLLADFTHEDLQRRFGGMTFKPTGPNHLVQNAADLFEQILTARKRGYAVVREEFEPELVGVSAPIRDFRGVIIAALNASGPKFRFGEALEIAGVHVAKGAAQLSRDLGWSLEN